MNSTTIRPLTPPGKTAARAFSAPSRFLRDVPLRASLPVVSNRAFIRAWAASRSKAGAAAAAAKRLAH